MRVIHILISDGDPRLFTDLTFSMAGTVSTSFMTNPARPTPYPRRKVANRATR